jgi:hypothetical protein
VNIEKYQNRYDTFHTPNPTCVVYNTPTIVCPTECSKNNKGIKSSVGTSPGNLYIYRYVYSKEVGQGAHLGTIRFS